MAKKYRTLRSEFKKMKIPKFKVSIKQSCFVLLTAVLCSTILALIDAGMAVLIKFLL